MQILSTLSPDFKKKLSLKLSRSEVFSEELESLVREVIQTVQNQKDKALFAYTEKWDAWSPTLDTVLVSSEEIAAAYRMLPVSALKVLELAAKRIKVFHEKMGLKSWQVVEDGILLGQRVMPLARVGIYVPGGKAAYPSSVLMNAIPARVAGVDEIIMVTPCPNGETNPAVLVAADLAGVDRIFKVGGAQAVAALAYGTDLIPRVDKIVGPGNRFVAAAKKQVFGHVAIDMIAGPSEILVLSDGSVPAKWLAADLLSQAEHDEAASAILISWDENSIMQVKDALSEILTTLPRAEIAKKSLAKHGALILAKDETEAIAISNEIAPEHLELAVKKPEKTLEGIRNAGAIFLGSQTTEAFGDYLAGPNHVLPTSGSARFSSPLSTFDFLKFSSVISSESEAVRELGPSVVTFAELEGLGAHALAMRYRILADKGE